MRHPISRRGNSLAKTCVRFPASVRSVAAMNEACICGISEIRGSSAAGRKLSCNFFRSSHDAKDVTALQLVDVGRLPAAIQELLSDERIGGDVFELGGNFGDAIEVGAEPHVIYAGDFGNVLD